jgi:hypothetical protein
VAGSHHGGTTEEKVRRADIAMSKTLTMQMRGS